MCVMNMAFFFLIRMVVLGFWILREREREMIREKIKVIKKMVKLGLRLFGRKTFSVKRFHHFRTFVSL